MNERDTKSQFLRNFSAPSTDWSMYRNIPFRGTVYLQTNVRAYKGKNVRVRNSQQELEKEAVRCQ